jgi:E3 ubiquitin-protein ligase UBR4
MTLNASDIFLKWCVACTPTISPTFNLKFDQELVLHQKSIPLPTTHADLQNVKQSLKQLDIDTKNILSVLQLPIMEPLTHPKILQLTQISLSSLYCCIVTSVTHNITSNVSAQPSAAPKSTTEPDPFEEVSRSVITQSLEIFKIVSGILKNQRNVHQNHLCMGAWLLLVGIQSAMSASGGSQKSSQLTPDDATKSKSPSRSLEPQPRVNLFKVQQSFGILNVTIAKYNIQLIEELLDELKVDFDENINEEILVSC